MSASASRLACVLLVAGFLGIAAAQDKINVEDLKIRSDAGNRNATRQLAEMYYLGRGEVERNFSEANRAAQRGHIQAQHNRGMLYHEGKGVVRDPLQAYFWLKVAALQGDDVSQESLKTVGKTMSTDQIRQAESQAEEWMKKYKKTVSQ